MKFCFLPSTFKFDVAAVSLLRSWAINCSFSFVYEEVPPFSRIIAGLNLHSKQSKPDFACKIENVVFFAAIYVHSKRVHVPP